LISLSWNLLTRCSVFKDQFFSSVDTERSRRQLLYHIILLFNYARSFFKRFSIQFASVDLATSKSQRKREL